MRRPESLRGFALRVLCWLVLAYAAWLYVVPQMLRGLWWVSDLLWPHLFFDSPRARIDIVDGHWRVLTAWRVVPAPGEPSSDAVAMIEAASLKHMVSGWPLLVALMLATRPFRPGRLLAALAGHGLIAWLTIAASIWHQLVVLSGTHTDFFTAIQPSPFKLQIEPAPLWQFYLSGYLMYLALLVIPFLAPVLLWAALSRRSLTRMLVAMRRRARARARQQQWRVAGSEGPLRRR